MEQAAGDFKYVELCEGVDGLDKVVLREVPGSSAEVYLCGGQVTSWKNRGEELLFMSEKAVFKPPKAIRGGILMCFPQFGSSEELKHQELAEKWFGSHGLLEHGFAQNSFWSIDTNPPPFPTKGTCKAFVDLILKPSVACTRLWPYRYEFRLRVMLGPGGDLTLTSRIRNASMDGKPFSYTFAYHAYFSVSDISEVRIEGLGTLHYLDNLKERELFTDQDVSITFESEVDRLYVNTPPRIAILDHNKRRTLILHKDGLPDAVVWNPWDMKAKSMTDFGAKEYTKMLCVDAACVEKPITLKPGEEWRGILELSAFPST